MASEVEILLKAVDKASKDIEDVKRRLKGLGEETETAGKKSKESGSAFDGMGGKLMRLAGTMGIAVGGAALLKKGIDFGKESIKAASDVEEMTSKFGFVFKELAGDVETELATLAGTINRSKYDLMGYAATLQDTFVPLGFARDEAAKMSVELVKLAEDLASFNNLDTADVVRDLQSALVGNTMTLRKYGIVAQETQIKQKALELGIWDGKDAMDVATKTSAIMAIAVESSGDAIGDAERTSDSYANTVRGLDAAMTELKVTIGDKLLPAATRWKQLQTEMVVTLTNSLTIQDRLNAALGNGTITQYEYNEIQGKLHSKMMDVAEAHDILADKEKIRSEQEAALQEQIRESIGAYEDRRNALVNATDALIEETDTTEKLKTAFSELKNLMSGQLGPEYTNFIAKNQELKDKARELKDQIADLAAQPYLTPDQKYELETLRWELGENSRAMDENAAAHEEATHRILHNLLLQRLAHHDLGEDGYRLANELAHAWGLIDEKTYQVTKDMDTYLSDFANSGNFDLLYNRIANIGDTAVWSFQAMKQAAYDAYTYIFDQIPWDLDSAPSHPLAPPGSSPPVKRPGGGIKGAAERLAKEVEEAIEPAYKKLLALGGALAGEGGFFSGLFGKRTVNPLEEKLKEISSAFDEAKKTFDEINVTSADDPNLYTKLRAWDKMISLTQERTAAQDALNEALEKQAALEKAQEDLSFLQHQFKLLELIKEYGLNAADVLGGITLGLEASLPDLVAAMTRAIKAMVEAAEDELGIQSPSKVFAEIGRNLMTGMARGIRGSDYVPTGAAVGAAGKVTQTTYNYFNQTVNTNASTDVTMNAYQRAKAWAGA